MKVIKPIVVGEAQLQSSSIPANEVPFYVSTQSYPLFARVTEGLSIYESIQTPNLGRTPSASPLYWTLIGPTNRYAMFDSEVSTQSIADKNLTVTIKTGYVNSIAFFNLQGTALKVTARDGIAGPVVYSKTTNLSGTIISDWYQHFFEPEVQMKEAVFTNLPPYTNAHLTVEITGGAEVRCGHVSAGTAYDLGGTEYGATVEILDFSKKVTSASGIASFSKGKVSKRITCKTFFPNGQLNKNLQVLEDLRATPCAWLGVPVAGYEVLSVFGFYRGASVEVSYATKSYCSLDIEGLT